MNTPARRRMTKIVRQMKNRTFAMAAEAPAIPVNPSMPATSAIMAKRMAYLNMAFSIVDVSLIRRISTLACVHEKLMVTGILHQTVVCWISNFPVLGSTSRLAHRSPVSAWRRLKCTIHCSDTELLNLKPLFASLRASRFATATRNCSGFITPPDIHPATSRSSSAISWQIVSTLVAIKCELRRVISYGPWSQSPFACYNSHRNRGGRSFRGRGSRDRAGAGKG